jgi:transcriptional regulator with GAF, ATPase, and Fis domain
MNTPQLKQQPANSRRADVNTSHELTSSPFLNLPKFPSHQPTIADARIASLKVLVLTLLTEIESLENRIDSFDAPLNLQEEVHRFEAALIRVALNKTGGRQRRAARLLGTKVTTLNTKIRRYGISVKDEG